MEQILKKMGWASIATSLAFMIIGIIIAYNPNTILTIISYLIGAIFVFIGIVKIISYFKTKGAYDLYNYELVYGIIAVLIGVIVVFCCDMIETLFRVFIGIWIIYSGAMRLGLALKLQKINASSKNWIIVLIISIVILACGIYIMVNPGTIIKTMGIIMIVYSIMDIIEEAIFMKNIKNVN